MLIILTLLTLKHFIFDFLYQPPYQWMNKGTYGHPGGIVHAGQHAIATGLILFLCVAPVLTWQYCLALAMLEFIIHYHMDWAKMKYNAYKGWGPNTHAQFWQLLGVDQLVHSLTYILIVALAIV